MLRLQIINTKKTQIVVVVITMFCVYTGWSDLLEQYCSQTTQTSASVHKGSNRNKHVILKHVRTRNKALFAQTFFSFVEHSRF